MNFLKGCEYNQQWIYTIVIKIDVIPFLIQKIVQNEWTAPQIYFNVQILSLT